MREIELSKTGTVNRGKYKAMVDDGVFKEVNKFDWCYSNGYASNSKMNIYLHVFIWKLKNGDIPDDKVVEHKDQNGLNNQISNLRLATHAENMRNISKKKNNTSGYIGVSKTVQKNKKEDGSISIYEYWICQWTDSEGIRRSKHFSYDNAGKVRAARYYDLMTSQAAEEYTGELNFQSLEEYQHELKKAILKDLENNS